MSEAPGSLATLDHARRWGIEPMFSDFKTRGFGLEDSQIRYPDRLARLILVMARALHFAVSTGQWEAARHATPAERRRPEHQPKNVLRSMTSWFTRGLRRIANLLQGASPTCSKPFSPSHNFGAFQQLVGAEPSLDCCL